MANTTIAMLQHEPLIAKRFQQWPEAAITYFGILVSGCKVVHTEPEARVMVVKDLELGTNDCRGWITKKSLQEAESSGRALLPVSAGIRGNPGERQLQNHGLTMLPTLLASTSSFRKVRSNPV